jgi:ABC-2 type transport system permease protein
VRPFAIIAWNSFCELLRQPAYLALLTGALAAIGLLANISYFGFGEEARLVKTTALSVLLLTGLINAVLSASVSIAQEVRTGTALALLAKPVGRTRFLLAKFLGLAAALGVQTYAGLLAALLASRMAFDAYGSWDWVAIAIFSGAILLAYMLGAASNYFVHRPFLADASLALVATVTLAFLAINCLDRHGAWQKFGANVDWRLIPAGLLVWFALLVLAGLAVACTTRLAMMPTLMACSGLFALGLLSDYLFGRAAGAGSWLAATLHTVLPNWQVFWMADRLGGEGTIPWSYVLRAGAYAGAYLTLVLSVGLILFEDRDLT